MDNGFQYLNGYSDLSPTHQAEFEIFMENFSRGLSTRNRDTLIPLGIYYVEHTEIRGTLFDWEFDGTDDIKGKEYTTVVSEEVQRISLDGSKTMHRVWKIDRFDEAKDIYRDEATRYLRFEYTNRTEVDDEEERRKQWLHVIDGGNQWY